jgi:AbrB family looped-hinge helix DNA binding protein
LGVGRFKNKEFLLSYMIEIMKMSSRGQIVIPLKIRRELEIEEGSIIGIEKIKDIILIKKVDQDLKNQFRNSLNDLKLGKIKRVA